LFVAMSSSILPARTLGHQSPTTTGPLRRAHLNVVDQLNAAAARFVWWWPVAIAVLLLGLMTMPWGLIIWVLGGAACVWLYFNDQARRTVVLFYDVHDGAHQWFDSLVAEWHWLTQSQGLWRVIQSGDVVGTYNYKVNAGASALVRTIGATASTSSKIKQLATNISIPSITAGNSSLYFLPDRLLVREGNRYSDVDYQELRVFHQDQRFIESGTPPRDAVQVDHTWQYVNVKGGPDRRYKNNRTLPIMLYGRLVVASASGLYWIIQISRAAAAEAVARVVSAAPTPSAAVSNETAPPSGGPGDAHVGQATKVRCANCGHIQTASVNAATFPCEKCAATLRRMKKSA
ncbi:hypothetical protein, partial [Mycobacterium bourgelatii]